MNNLSIWLHAQGNHYFLNYMFGNFKIWMKIEHLIGQHEEAQCLAWYPSNRCILRDRSWRKSWALTVRERIYNKLIPCICLFVYLIDWAPNWLWKYNSSLIIINLNNRLWSSNRVGRECWIYLFIFFMVAWKLNQLMILNSTAW